MQYESEEEYNAAMEGQAQEEAEAAAAAAEGEAAAAEAEANEIPEISLELFHPKKAELVTLANQYKDLAIKGIDDKEGYKAVHDARMVLRSARTGIVATRKAYTKQFDEAKAHAMAKEKELVGIISPVEEELERKEVEIDKAKEEIKLEAERKAQQITNDRIEALAKVGYTHDLFELRLMEDERFQEILAEKTKAHEDAEKARIEKEEADRKEREEFDRKKAAQDAKEKEIADREAAIEAKEKAARDEETAKERAAEIERERKDAADKAAKETEERLKREAEEKKRREEEEQAAKDAAAKEEQAKLEKKKKYLAFLESVGYTEENKHEFRIDRQTDPSKVIIMRIVGEFTL